ncbi:AfsR/SARP family transcriptional regulator [Amycolatopsis nigrescens]|uniref:AfsR/SARP family transcriptional regulator n=1 Tax=Amycolatopsis nigrescens TaxID=381445 RepID=UPI000375E218|nr:tetratricopeptide repeat protein [Amycolatopsis nigrescens]
MTAEFVTFGNVEMWLNGRLVDIGYPRQRYVLAALLFDVNRTVRAEELIVRVWGENPPHRARGTLHTYLSHLRKALSCARDIRIIRQVGGYTLTTDPLAVDLHRFRRLIGQARAADDQDDAVRLLEAALDLVRGDFCTGVDTPWMSFVRESLDQERIAAELDLADLKLRGGSHTELVPELAARTAQRPLDERLAGQFMLALARSGRPADALAHYQKTRGLLAEELGIDPDTALRELHQRILVADSVITHSAPATEPPTPRQLPATTGLFTGRATELARLTELRHHATKASDPAVIGVIGGGGVGKTWLALRWAHEHVHEFPDGQLFVELHGFAPSSPPLPVAEAMRGLLQALGVAPGAIPAESHAQTGLYRSLVAGKRLLVVLDNARDTSQVVPLLPGSPTCVVVVTSRHQLTGLAVEHGADIVPLDVFNTADATALLARCAGAGRVTAEPDALAALVDRCGRLPLAVGIVAARATAHPGFPLTALAAELEGADRLDALTSGELTANVRAVLTSSRHALDSQAALLLGLVGLAPGPDIGVPAAASLLELPTNRARALLQELVAVHLVHEHHPNRYRMHDLVRLYAAERALADHPAAVRAAALRRLTDYYLRTASTATDILLARAHRPRPLSQHPPTSAPVPSTYDEALTWLESERPNLLALAARSDEPTVLGELSRTLRHYLDLRGYHEDARTLHTAALAAARRTGDRGLEAHTLVALSLVQWRWGRYTHAALQQCHAVAVARRHDHPDIEGYALHYLGSTAARLGNYELALRFHWQSLALSRAIGDHDIEGCNLDAIGIVHWYLGDYEQALEYSQQGLALARRTGNLYVEAHALNNLGLIHHRTERYAEARRRFEQALALARSSGSRYVESNALNGLGLVHRELGDVQQARAYLQQAIEAARETGNRSHEAEIHNNLGELAQHTGDPATALKHHQQALTITQATSEPLGQATAHNHLATCYRDLDQPHRARQHRETARTLHRDLGTPPHGTANGACC